MEPSTYTEVSKRIGHSDAALHMPPVEIAEELLEYTKKGNVGAWEAAFRYYRFGITPESDGERESLRIITEAYNHGKSLFS